MLVVIPGATEVGLFVGAALALLLIPGPAVLFIVGRSVEQGRRAGFVSIVGIHAATLVHVFAAAVGLSALLASSAWAFGAVKYAGAIYLIWLGYRKLVAPKQVVEEIPVQSFSHARLISDGFIVNLLNPKTALFFLAFVPQFVDPTRGGVATQIVFLGILYTALGFVTDSIYAISAGAAGGLLKRSRIYRVLERYVSAILLIGLGVTAAVAGHHKR